MVEFCDRAWVLAVLERVMTRLPDACAAEAKAGWFSQARGYLMVGEATIPHREAAEELKLDESAVGVAVQLLRGRYRELRRAKIVQTLCDPGKAAEGLRSLRTAPA